MTVKCVVCLFKQIIKNTHFNKTSSPYNSGFISCPITSSKLSMYRSSCNLKACSFFRSSLNPLWVSGRKKAMTKYKIGVNNNPPRKIEKFRDIMKIKTVSTKNTTVLITNFFNFITSLR